MEITEEQARDVKVGLVAGLGIAEWAGKHENCDGSCFICEGLQAIMEVRGESPSESMTRK